MRLRGFYKITNRIRFTHLSFMRASSLNRREVPDGAMYNKILALLFRKIFDEIIYQGYNFRYRKLGKFLAVMFYPTVREDDDGKIITNKPVDYPTTFRLRRETGNKDLKVYFDNEDTGGLVYRVMWDTSTAHFTNKSFYSFSLNGNLKKIFSAAVKSNLVRATLVNFKV